MEPTLIALGLSLLCASLVPLMYGRYGRGAALAYLGAVAWGSGVNASPGTLMVISLVAAGLAAGMGIAVVGARRLTALRRLA